MFKYTILAYNTRRQHVIVCENNATLNEICSERFRYTPIHQDKGIYLEPNWCILEIEEYNAKQS